MRRLSIIDLEGGSQPIWNEDHTICVFFNGEIYNYIELREELRRSGHCFRTRSDTEVLVHLYEEYGEEMTKFLRGMFAFCILDERSGSLFLARDHFGQKPLYFTHSGNRFAFASELKALMALPWVDREIGRGGVSRLCSMAIAATTYALPSIHKLSAGSSMRISLTAPKCEPRRYWRYDLSGDRTSMTLNLAIAELDRALSDSVALHLQPMSVGNILSSGLDSRRFSPTPSSAPCRKG